MKQLVIAISGKKQSGKSSTCNYIASKYFNLIHPDLYYFGVNSLGELTFGQSVISIDKAFEIMRREPDVKLYSFADPLKDFCINVLGASRESCYGTDEQKDAPIAHLLWENTPLETRPVTTKFHEPIYKEFAGCVRQGWEEDVHKSGPMSG